MPETMADDMQRRLESQLAPGCWWPMEYDPCPLRPAREQGKWADGQAALEAEHPLSLRRVVRTNELTEAR